MPLVILKWKNQFKKCTELAHNSQKWCAEFACYVRRISNFFGAEF